MKSQLYGALKDFKKYPNQIQPFINDIEKGSCTLDNYVYQIQRIMSDPSEAIISKVLAMRFARDIMVMGRQDVVNRLTKIVPQLVQVCSHRLQSNDFNRGNSFFYYHEEYKKAQSQDKRNQIELQGSTYFVLCLQSIQQWAKWIPSDQRGNQSEYSKGYNQLLKRGVRFKTDFHYYKNADTDKFKKTYKVQFFTESQYDNDSQGSNIDKSLSSNISSITIHEIRSGTDIRQYINYNKLTTKKINNLQKKVIDLYDKYMNQRRVLTNTQSIQKQYIQKFMIYSNLLHHNKITLEEFSQQLTTQQLHLSAENQNLQNVSIHKKTNKAYGSYSGSHKIKQIQKSEYEQLLEKQEQAYNRKINFLKKQLEDRLNQLKSMKQHQNMEIEQIKHEYESRIQIIKKGVIDNSGQKTKYLYKQNQNLKQKLLYLQQKQKSKQYSDLRYQNAERQHELQIQNLRLTRQIQQIKIQNQKLKNTRNLPISPRSSTLKVQNKNQINQLRTNIKKLQGQLNGYRARGNDSEAEISKRNKKISNLSEELKIYKIQLADQRQKYSLQIQRKNKIIANYQSDLLIFKEKLLYLQKKMDLKDIENAQLQQQIKLCKLMDQQANIMLKNYNVQERDKIKSIQSASQVSYGSQLDKCRGSHVSPSKHLHSLNNDKPINYKFKYKKYETLRNKLYNRNREQWYRLAKCSLKKKDILFKQNQFEVGIIFDNIQWTKMEATLFCTNISENQTDNIQLSKFIHSSAVKQVETEQTKDIQIKLGTSFIFCLQPHQQQKISLQLYQKEPLKPIYEPTMLQIQFSKKGKLYKNKMYLPNFVFKSVEYSSIKSHRYGSIIADLRQRFENKQMSIDPLQEQKYGVKFTYSTNILNQKKQIFVYFPGIQKISKQVQNDKYCGIAKIKEYSIEFVIKLELKAQNVMKVRLLPLRKIFESQKQKLINIQEQIYRDFLSFIQFCFRR